MHQLEVEEINLPKSLEPDELLAETVYSVVSPGTELAAWNGLPLRSGSLYPRLLGYCNLARVTAVGDEVEEIGVGDFVLTHQSHRSSFVVSRGDVLLFFKSLSQEKLKLLSATYLYHLGYCALLAGGYFPGNRVAVIGMGTLGFNLVELLQTFGCEPCLFSDQLPGPNLNATFAEGSKVISKRIALDEGKIQDYFDGPLGSQMGLDGFDLIVNTSNLWRDHLLALKLARTGGTIVCLGFPGRGQSDLKFNPLEAEYFYDKQLTIKHCGHVPSGDVAAIDNRFNLKRNLAYLASLILSGQLNPSAIYSIESDWRELESVYRQLSNREPGQYSAILSW
ncbi:MAG: hypothetical protein KC652_14545 [Cyanobacteria bacterium HKST-UBA01]|nr:hypothetical protein [Cyanobacteria bacterium HKST-UBA01]